MSQTSEHDTAQLAILLVEPSSMQLKVIMNHLKQAGVSRIDGVADGQEALAFARKYPPDLIISAMYLPDMTADELLQTLRQEDRFDSTHFMLISSERKPAALEKLRQTGVVAILPKPFDHADLKRALRTTMDYIEPQEISLENYDVSQLRLLMVDDSSTSRNHIQRVLNQMGIHAIDSAENGSQAMLLLQQYEYDLMLTDLNMLEMDGEQLVNYVRNEMNNTLLPILMVTTERDPSRLEQVEQSGVSAILDKPFEPESIREMMYRALG